MDPLLRSVQHSCCYALLKCNLLLVLSLMKQLPECLDVTVLLLTQADQQPSVSLEFCEAFASNMLCGAIDYYKRQP